jgi:aryl-alcohol dehydrogenase-like predicted oxidoreductase
MADAAAQVAKELGLSSTQIACASILQAPGVTAPIIGATKTHQLKELFDAVDIKLSRPTGMNISGGDHSR